MYLLRNHEWTTPSNDSGYPGEIVRNGWDSDYDYLPDGWEVEFNLNPRSGALFIFNGTNDVVNPNGEWGDPDADGLVNTEEYLGQDGNRGTNNPFVNGSGDETNPNGHNWRPDSTGSGTGVSRPEYEPWWDTGISPEATLGAALPTTSVGFDTGSDTDDDGIPDSVEIQQEYATGTLGTSPVHSMSPFVERSALIVSTNGIVLPDPEGSPAHGYRADLHARDWTLECYVKILTPGRSGWLIKIPGPGALEGIVDLTCALSLSNDVPVVSFQTAGGFLYRVSGLTLPSGQWTHLAGVWDHAQNTLALYVDGIFVQQTRIYQECVSSHHYSTATPPTLGESPSGPASFTNQLMLDEVRIWGLARSADQIEQFRRLLLPQSSAGLLGYFRFDDGGQTAEDFARKAKNGLLGAATEGQAGPVVTDYTFGDFGYAPGTSGFAFSAPDAAPVFGVSEAGADDSDGDAMPDDWEMINNLNPYSATGDEGEQGDPDGDGLVNVYEFWSRTNPQAPDTYGDGVLDGQRDFDGEGVPNAIEQLLGSRPDIIDTDDDGFDDNVEQALGTDPTDPLDPGDIESPVIRRVRGRLRADSNGEQATPHGLDPGSMGHGRCGRERRNDRPPNRPEPRGGPVCPQLRLGNRDQLAGSPPLRRIRHPGWHPVLRPWQPHSHRKLGSPGRLVQQSGIAPGSGDLHQRHARRGDERAVQPPSHERKGRRHIRADWRSF